MSWRVAALRVVNSRAILKDSELRSSVDFGQLSMRDTSTVIAGRGAKLTSKSVQGRSSEFMGVAHRAPPLSTMPVTCCACQD
jgi:hypothetical protein